jgi:hypothetical protein
VHFKIGGEDCFETDEHAKPIMIHFSRFKIAATEQKIDMVL